MSFHLLLNGLVNGKSNYPFPLFESIPLHLNLNH